MIDNNFKGKATFTNGVYEGEWDSNGAYKKGKKTFPKGTLHEGEWDSDRNFKEGKKTCPNGDVCEGE